MSAPANSVFQTVVASEQFAIHYESRRTEDTKLMRMAVSESQSCSCSRTGSSNPSPSSGESANFRSLSVMTPSLCCSGATPCSDKLRSYSGVQHDHQFCLAVGNEPRFRAADQATLSPPDPGVLPERAIRNIGLFVLARFIIVVRLARSHQVHTNCPSSSSLS